MSEKSLTPAPRLLFRPLSLSPGERGTGAGVACSALFSPLPAAGFARSASVSRASSSIRASPSPSSSAASFHAVAPVAAATAGFALVFRGAAAAAHAGFAAETVPPLRATSTKPARRRAFCRAAAGL